eukprot:1092849-Prorocentrum_lima.AAC.1
MVCEMHGGFLPWAVRHLGSVHPNAQCSGLWVRLPEARPVQFVLGARCLRGRALVEPVRLGLFGL